MAYNPNKCEDDDDASRMAETILRYLGYENVQRGTNKYSVDASLPKDDLHRIAKHAERIARWARKEMQGG